MRRRFAILIRCVALGLFGAQVMADDSLRHFDIQPQATASALNEFARQADITLVFSSAVVAKYQTAGIKGDFTILDGLRQLLIGSGLHFSQMSAKAIAVSADAAPGPPRDPSAGAAQSDTSDKGNSNKGDNANHQGIFSRIAALIVGGAAVPGARAYAHEPAAPAAGAETMPAPPTPAPWRRLWSPAALNPRV